MWDHHSQLTVQCVVHFPLLFSKRFCKLIDSRNIRYVDRDDMRRVVSVLRDVPNNSHTSEKVQVELLWEWIDVERACKD